MAVSIQNKSVLEKRYSLHEISARIMTDVRFSTEAEDIEIQRGSLPRVACCHKVPLIQGKTVNHVQGVPVRKHENGGVSFGGLMSCGSVWVCPVCAAKISEYRCREVARAFDLWKEQKDANTQIMITYTIPHYSDQSISELRAVFMTARRLMKHQRRYKKRKQIVYSDVQREFGFKGSVSGIEVTLGYNGWHVHSHDILFIDNDITDLQIEKLKTDLTSCWVNACLRAKVKIKNKKNMRDHSVNIRRAKTAAEYVAKFGQIDFDAHKDLLAKSWGPAQEISKSHVKTGYGKKGFTPWDLLRQIESSPDDLDIYMKYGSKFREYAREFKGKRQLFFSKGFKQFLGLDSKSDAEIVQDEQESINDVVGVIPPIVWRGIVRSKLRGWVLNTAKNTELRTESDFLVFLDIIIRRIKDEKS